MRKLITPVILLVAVNLMAQPDIDHLDMPNAGDTIRTSINLDLEGTDFSLTGTDYVWNYSTLQFTTQKVDTFIDVTTTPFAYQYVFNNPFDPNHQASVASKQNILEAILNMPLQESCLFYKETDQAFGTIGVAATLNGIPIPLAFSSMDKEYQFPVTYADEYASEANIMQEIPGIGYLMMKRDRTSTVDGYGTLTTPYGTYSTLRIKSEITEYDSIYLQSTGTGIPITRNITEYKWLGNDMGIPLLHVSVEAMTTRVQYIDSVRNNSVAINTHPLSPKTINLFPVPATNTLAITSNNGKLITRLTCYNTNGLVVWQNRFNGLTHYNWNIPASLPAGIYFLKIHSNSQAVMKKIIIN